MLILSRKKNERIFIGDNIEVVVTEIYGGTVQLGFTAPPEIIIVREEVRRKELLNKVGKLI